MDIFRANAAGAFSMMELTATLLDAAHVPMRIGQMGLFNSRGIRTLDVGIERQANTLVLVPTTPRGGAAYQNQRDDRSLIKVPTSRIAIEEGITADQVQSIRALGSETELRSVQEEVNQANARMSNSIEATIEFQRIGALKGLVLDADGSTLIDLYDTFGVVAQTEVAFDLANSANGALRTIVSGVIRTIEDELGNLAYTDIYAMCSSQFFDAFAANPEYRQYQLNNPLAAQLAERVARRRVIEFGGVTWEEYRGRVGSTKYVDDDKCHIFPLGVPDFLLTRYAPAEWWETVNTIGLPRYASLFPDRDSPNSKMVSRVQTQILNICTRPRALVKGKKGA